MDNLNEIHDFAKKWLERFEAGNVDYAVLSEECASLRFIAGISEIDGKNENISGAMRLGSSIRLMCSNTPEKHRE